MSTRQQITGSIAILAVLCIVNYAISSEWVAYNDSVYKDGQVIADNVTTFGIGRTNIYPETGNLIKFSDGSDTGITITYSEFKTVGSLNWAGDEGQFDEGSDAAEIFNGIVDASGNISYGDAPGWYLDLIIEGLDPDGLYTFAGSVNRNGDPSYEDRVTNWTIMGVESFTYASSEDAHKVSEDSVEFVTGDNDKGYVAKWIDINPDRDGEIVIRTTHGVGKENGGIADANGNKGYAGGVLMLEFQGMKAVDASGKLATTWSKVKSDHYRISR